MVISGSDRTPVAPSLARLRGTLRRVCRRVPERLRCQSPRSWTTCPQFTQEARPVGVGGQFSASLAPSPTVHGSKVESMSSRSLPRPPDSVSPVIRLLYTEGIHWGWSAEVLFSFRCRSYVPSPKAPSLCRWCCRACHAGSGIPAVRSGSVVPSAGEDDVVAPAARLDAEEQIAVIESGLPFAM